MVQEHVDAAQVVGSRVDLLAEVALADVLGAQDLGELEQQRARAAGRVVYLVDGGLVADDDAREQLRDLLRGEELTARLARAAGVHVHEVLVGVAEQVDLCVAHTSEVQVADAGDDLGQAGDALLERGAEFVGGHVHVVEQALEVLLGRATHARPFDRFEDLGNVDVELGVLLGRFGDVLEELGGEDEVALELNQVLADALRLLVGEVGVGEIGVAGSALVLVDVFRQVLGDEAVEQEAQDICLEIPAVHGAADLVGDFPDGFVELGALSLAVRRGCQGQAPLSCRRHARRRNGRTVGIGVTPRADIARPRRRRMGRRRVEGRIRQTLPGESDLAHRRFYRLSIASWNSSIT